VTLTRDDLIAAGMLAYKGNPKLDPTSVGLTWLRTPMERVVDTLTPMIRADEQEWERRDDAD
jgi:hypothetical protein